jgi:hypothetical protein
VPKWFAYQRFTWWDQQAKKNQRIEGNLHIYLDLHC